MRLGAGFVTLSLRIARNRLATDALALGLRGKSFGFSNQRG